MQILEKTPDAKIVYPDTNKVHRRVTREVCLTCCETTNSNVHLRIKHGISLLLENVEWKAARECVAVPIIGRRMLESLGCENQKMLLAARDKHGEKIDVVRGLADAGDDEERTGKIAALFGESVFHSEGNIEKDGIIFEETCVDSGNDEPKVIEKA